MSGAKAPSIKLCCISHIIFQCFISFAVILESWGFFKKNVQPFFNAIQRGGKKGHFNEKSTIQAMKDIQEIIEDQWFKEKVY
jgi:hypothetical protein